MCGRPTPTRTETTAQTDHAADDVRHLRSVLLELIDMGRDLARLVHQQAITALTEALSAPPSIRFFELTSV